MSDDVDDTSVIETWDCLRIIDADTRRELLKVKGTPEQEHDDEKR